MLKVTFVDDEKPILDGLRRTLRSHRRSWDMRFHTGAREALQAMEDDPPDVIVSDVRMPGMDGAALLQAVKQRHPETVRITLSGHADADATKALVSVAHQYLSKPCDAAMLERTITRALDVRSLVENPKTRRIIGAIEHLPSAPSLFHELSELLADEQVHVEAVAQLLESDAALTAKVLQLVNSAFYGLPRKVDCVARAVTLLGLTGVRDLVLTVEGLGSFDKVVDTAAIEEIRSRCLHVASLAQHLASGRDAKAQAFSTAMLSEVGVLAIVATAPRWYRSLQREAKSSGVTIASLQERELGTTHHGIGAYLLGLWGLPEEMVHAVHSYGAPTGTTLDLTGILHVASTLVRQRFGEPVTLDPTFVAAAGITEDIEGWRQWQPEEQAA